ncbi:MAG: 30S ribosomal protein S6 [Chloroflexi bacterium]|nr:30S ribosomal protein S6 [Chloroflexota bacterium]|tara:strand:+ start:188 stop:532 length:345 start_codon:yes stop_codon:yes gene_type:complete
MNNNTYELAMVVSPELRPEEIDSLCTQLYGLLEKNNSKQIHTAKTKVKKLSYPINNFVEATYVYVILESNSSDVKILDKWLSDNPSVIRSLVIKLTPAELKFRENNILNQVANN